MRVMMLTTAAPNQVALSRKLAAEVDLIGLIFSDNLTPGSQGPRGAMERLGRGMVGWRLHRAWASALETLAERHGANPPIEPLTVPEINDPTVRAAIEATSPELIVVSGTNLVKQPVLEAGSRSGGFVNLHTGISPWVKGGPNCTNWCLADRRPELIGNTVMWIDLGVDSGDLIATEQAPLTGDESLSELHVAVLEHAHDLLIRAVRRFRDGQAVPRISQATIGDGPTYRNADWGAPEMIRAQWHFWRDYKAESLRHEPPEMVALDA